MSARQIVQTICVSPHSAMFYEALAVATAYPTKAPRMSIRPVGCLTLDLVASLNTGIRHFFRFSPKSLVRQSILWIAIYCREHPGRLPYIPRYREISPDLCLPPVSGQLRPMNPRAISPTDFMTYRLLTGSRAGGAPNEGYPRNLGTPRE